MTFINKDNVQGKSANDLSETGIKNASSNDESFRNEQFQAALQRQKTQGMGISANSNASFGHNGIHNSSSNDPNYLEQQIEIARNKHR